MITAGKELHKLFAFCQLSDKKVRIHLTPSKAEAVIYKQWSLNRSVCLKKVTLSDFENFERQIQNLVSETPSPNLDQTLDKLDCIFNGQNLEIEIDSACYTKNGPPLNINSGSAENVYCVLTPANKDWTCKDLSWATDCIRILNEKAYGGFRFPAKKMPKYDFDCE